MKVVRQQPRKDMTFVVYAKPHLNVCVNTLTEFECWFTLSIHTLVGRLPYSRKELQMFSSCPKCGHSIFDHDSAHDGCCEAKGCQCRNNLEDATGDVLHKMDFWFQNASMQINRICKAIEQLPASPLQTRISILASHLAADIAAQQSLAVDAGEG